jgi:hypothetical protein
MRKWGVCLALFLLALLPRILDPGAPITWDEPKWANRSLRFLSALRRGKWGKTFLVGHPGVTTMWLGATGITLQCRLQPDACEDLSLLSASSGEQYESEEALKQLPRLLPAAKLPLAFVIAASVVGMYLLARRLFRPPIALLGAVLIATDPFYLAHSRVLQLDGLTTTFMMLSLLALLIHLSSRGSRMLVLSGALAGLAVLSKSSALFMLPFTGLALATTAWREHGASKKAIMKTLLPFALWMGSAMVTFFILWPAMWVDPLGTVRGVLEKGIGYAQSPHASLNFFWGQVRADPGPGFYPVALLFRMTPLAVIGLAAIILLLSREAEEQKGRGNFSPAPLLIALLAYALLFGLFMTVGAKKFDRYLLPVFPALDIVAAAGLVGLVDRVRQAMGIHTWFPDSLIPWFPVYLLIVFFQVAQILPYHPYYLAYYNPLLGDGARAVKAILVGWGEGMDQVARYLNQKEGANQLRVAVWIQPGFTPFFHGHSTTFLDFTAAKADYVVFYVSDVQRRFHKSAHAMFDAQEPEHVVRIHGVDYAWIYRNDHALAVSRYLDEHGQAGDAIVLSIESVFSRQYQGLLPIYTIPPPGADGEAQVVSDLTRVAQGHRRVWYLHYDRRSNEQDMVLYYLTAYGRPMERQSFPPFDVALISYHLSDPPFTVTPLRPLSDAGFGGQLEAKGVGFGARSVEAGWPLSVTLEWQTQADLNRDYSVSLTLMDAEGHLWGRVDEGLLDRKGHPTSRWVGGATDREWYLLPVLPGTPPGTYQVQAVVYSPVDGKRLNVLDQNGAPLGTELTLGTVEVQRPAVSPSLETLEIPHLLQAQLSEASQLLGYSLHDDPLTPGEQRTLTLFWQALEDGIRDYDVRVRWQDEEGRTWAEAILSNAFHPTSQWQRGEIIRGQYDLVVDAAAPAGQSTLWLDLVEAASGQPMSGPGITLAQLQVMAPEREFTPPPDIAHPQRADLGRRVTLLGYNLDRTVMGPGETLHLTLYWQAQAEMETSYTVFTHLLDAGQRIWGQKDSLPLGGARPTTGWLTGEVITDEYAIPVQPDVPPGTYALEVGMYDAATGARLPVHDAQGRPVPGDRVLLDTTVEVR